MIDDFESCYNAVSSRDPRFDGWFVVAVRSTGIYCRPSCPARTPARRNVTFHPSAASAQRAGFRACKRCRPDAAAGSPEWSTRSDTVARAMRLIADGVIERVGVPGLAREVGYSVRQLERVMTAEVGAGPLAIARAQRAQTARTLIESTDLTMSVVAHAAGFASIRQFNDTVRSVFACRPSDLRARAQRPATESKARSRLVEPATGTNASGALVALDLRLPFRPPFEPVSVFGHLAATAVPGVEEVLGATYRRTLRLPGGPAIVALTPQEDHVACRLLLADVGDLTVALARCRAMLDLDADPTAVDATLSLDRKLRAVVRRSPGKRVPRTVDGAELALRAVLGQQVSTAAARTHAARLVAQHGERVHDPEGMLTHLFPEPHALVGASAALPAARRRTLDLLARALAAGDLDLSPGADWGATRAGLRQIPGVGPWTLDLISMRALGDPDIALPSDLGVRAAAAALGLPTRPAEFRAVTEPWAPWRSYAVQYLWSTLDHAINCWPGTARS